MSQFLPPTISLSGKVHALYFAADWCPDCRDFQPTLNAFYDKVNEKEHVFDIIFVSSDETEQDQEQHYREKQRPWQVIPFESPLKNELKRKYGVCAGREQQAVGVQERLGGIPSVVIVAANGDLIDLHGVDKIESLGAAAIQEWLNK
ncbi:hypothetical protein THRCLA_20432 [Thraustotheca clavata]|uniref:Thioredoxin domain-containing protein n=1 Tax=Thraustotheca clavata TaxID=74557 RepID=A0A1W0A783_9STRA|nr:hypothetical protein THRCLA_20432 [Thraustotheca clavata]